jgi:pilus assembly protein CpaE
MKLPICLIGDDNKTLAALKQQLERQAAYAVESKGCSYGDALERLRGYSGPVIAVMDLSRDPDTAYAVAAEFKSKLPHVRLVMTSPSHNPNEILRAMRSGAEEFFTQPFDWPEVIKSLEAIRNKVDVHTARTVERGQIVAVSSNKGGVGSTTVATNLAACLVAHKKSVCLVKHASGIRVLAEPFYAEDARRITPADIEEILEVLSQSFDFVVVDTPKEFDESLALVLDKANMILFVTEMDVPSLKSAHRAFELFSRMGIYEKKIRLVLNRFIKSKLMSLESAEKALGAKVFWTLPNNYPTAIAAVNQGLSIQDCDPRSDIARSYSGLADAVFESFSTASTSRREADEKRVGLLDRWMPVRGLLK